MNILAFDPRGYSIPGDRAAYCLDCGAVFLLGLEACPRCTATTFVALEKFLSAIAVAKATPVRTKSRRRA